MFSFYDVFILCLPKRITLYYKMPSNLIQTPNLKTSKNVKSLLVNFTINEILNFGKLTFIVKR